jgi:hypothetical protein
LRPASSSTLRTDVAVLYPQCGFSRASRRISSRNERPSGGRPARPANMPAAPPVRDAKAGSRAPSSDAAAPATTPARTDSAPSHTRTTRANTYTNDQSKQPLPRPTAKSPEPNQPDAHREPRGHEDEQRLAETLAAVLDDSRYTTIATTDAGRTRTRPARPTGDRPIVTTDSGEQ